jgi:hypothetical protein
MAIWLITNLGVAPAITGTKMGGVWETGAAGFEPRASVIDVPGAPHEYPCGGVQVFTVMIAVVSAVMVSVAVASCALFA